MMLLSLKIQPLVRRIAEEDETRLNQYYAITGTFDNPRRAIRLISLLRLDLGLPQSAEDLQQTSTFWQHTTVVHHSAFVAQYRSLSTLVPILTCLAP